MAEKLSPASDPIAPRPRQMATMAAFICLIAGLIGTVDYFAFLNGATATISQVWLWINRKVPALPYITALAMGVLLQHVAIARQPGTPSDPPYSITQAMLWAVMFLMGTAISWRWLYQLPNVD